MPIPALPIAPSRSDPANFPARADAFMAALPTWGDAANALGIDVTDKQTLTATAAAAAQVASIAAQAAANYKGLWTGLAGALNIPASVFHAGNFWVLTSSLANVTTATPGVSSAWQMMNGTMVSPAMAPVVGAASLEAAGLLLANGVAMAGFRNKIINGGFDIWQRGVSFVASGSRYGPDRWQVFRTAGGSGATFTCVTYNGNNAPGAQFALRMQRNSGDTTTATVSAATSFETKDVVRMRGKTLTVSFYSLCSASVPAPGVVLTVLQGTGLDGNAFSGLTGSTVLGTVAQTSTSYVRTSVTVTVGAAATQLALVFGYTPTGTAGASEYVELSGVQMEEGSVATAFEQRPQSLEALLCQRYYQQVRGTSAPARPAYTYYNFPVEMRAIPTLALVTGAVSGADYGAPSAAGMRCPEGTVANATSDWVISASAEL